MLRRVSVRFAFPAGLSDALPLVSVVVFVESFSYPSGHPLLDDRESIVRRFGHRGSACGTCRPPT